MDLFGKKTQKELEQLHKKKNDLELRYNDMVAKHSRVSEELRESTALAASINAAKKSAAQHADEKRGHDQKADEFARKSKDIASKEAELLEVHEKKKTSLTKEMRELEDKVSTIKAELSDFQDQANLLGKEISNKKNKQHSISVEIQKLSWKRSNTEISYKEVLGKQSELL